MNQVLNQDDSFQQYLQENHYTFVGPQNPNLLEPFIKTVNQIAPTNIFHTIHDALSNRNATRAAIEYLPMITE